MPARHASPDPTRRPAARRWVAAVALAVALAVGVVASGVAVGQPPAPAPGAAPGDVDDKSPLPASEPPVSPIPEKYRIDANRLAFQEIDDPGPARSEKEKPGEYQAWNETTMFVRQFPVAELDAVARRTLTAEDLTEESRKFYRLQPVHFDGRMTAVRRIEPTQFLREAGVKDSYEGWLVPTDEPPTHKVCVVFTELPPGVDSPDKLADRWVSLAGYSFKLLLYPPDATAAADPQLVGWKRAPLLIARSVTPLPGPPVPPGAADCRIPDKTLRIFRLIRDDAKIASDDSNWAEAAAWNWVVQFARKFPTVDLEKNAKRVTFLDLFEPLRQDHKLDLVKLDGTVVSLRETKATRRLSDAGVAKTYEAWVVPDGEAGRHPVVFVFTDLPDGVTVPERPNDVRLPVSIAGYSFKLMQYPSSEMKYDKPVVKRAPLLIGRGLTVRPEPDTSSPWGATLLFIVIGSTFGLAGAAYLLSVWYRKGDRQVKAVVEARRANPFGD